MAAFSSDPRGLLKELDALEPEAARRRSSTPWPRRPRAWSRARTASGRSCSSPTASTTPASYRRRRDGRDPAAGLHAGLRRRDEERGVRPVDGQEREELALDNLKMLAPSSGGKMFLAAGEEDLRPLAAKIDAEVRKQYLLGFTPSGRGEVKYRVVVVSVAKPGSLGRPGPAGLPGNAPRRRPEETRSTKEGCMVNRRWRQSGGRGRRASSRHFRPHRLRDQALRGRGGL